MVVSGGMSDVGQNRAEIICGGAVSRNRSMGPVPLACELGGSGHAGGGPCGWREVVGHQANRPSTEVQDPLACHGRAGLCATSF